MDFENLSFENIQDLILTYGLPLLKAILILIIGFWLIGWITRLVKKGLSKWEIDVTLQKFVSDFVNVLLKVILFITVLQIFGVQTASLVAILGAAGLAVGLALQGSLSNFAGGVLLLLFKPFKVGDLIEAQGHLGHVESINIFVSKLITLDNKLVIVPNGPLANGDIVNYTAEGKLRVDLVIGVSYDTDIRQAREVIMNVMENHSKVLKDPAPSVNVLELGDSSVNLAVRPYATPEDYWAVYFGITENTKIALDEAGIEIPFPQRVIHHAESLTDLNKMTL